MTNRPPNPFAGCPSPPTRPIDRCERGQYETGRPGNGNFNDPTLPQQPWEDQQFTQLLQFPGSLMFFNAVFSTAVVVPVYILLFDVAAENGFASISSGDIARYTFGPCLPVVTTDPAISSGGTITYEASAEQVYNTHARACIHGKLDCGQCTDRRAWSLGIPFNFGIAAAASAAPRIYTEGEDVIEWAIAARFQT